MKMWQKPLLAGIAVVLISGIAYGAFYFRSQDQFIQKEVVSNDPNIPPASDPRDQDNDGLTDAQERELGTDLLNADTDGDGYMDGEEVKSGHSPLEPTPTTSVGDVPVSDAPEQSITLEVAWEKTLRNSGYDSFENGKIVSLKGGEGYEKMYDIGRVVSGSYADYRIFLQLVGVMGGWEHAYYLVAPEQDSGRLNTLNALKIVTSIHESAGDNVIAASFAHVEQPESMPIPESTFVLQRDQWGLSGLASEYALLPAFLQNGVQVYFEKETGCPLLKNVDFTVTSYHFKLDFIREDGMLDLTFADGAQNAEQYNYTIPTCGGGCTRYRFVDEKKIIPEKDLVPVGKTPQGFQFFFFKDANHPVLKKQYDEFHGYYILGGSFAEFENADTLAKISYTDFLATHPFLYWKDPFGRWIEFQNRAFLPPAEMCKPVVYLYPEHETNVNVQVFPNGGMSIAEPEYPAGGWNVRAYPDGQLVDRTDRQTYSSLVWEGKALQFAPPKQGFVIARDDVGDFFRTSLALQGLNAKEREEFRKYWEPRMRDFPYYFITFVPQDVFDHYAPLLITPKPDSVIRVFMSARGLAAPISVEPLSLVPRERNGFAVVEWGGTLQ